MGGEPGASELVLDLLMPLTGVAALTGPDPCLSLPLV